MYTDYVDENEDNQEENDYYSDDGSNSSNDNKEKIKKIAFFAGIFCILLIIIVLLAKGCANKKDKGGIDDNLVVTIAISRTSLTLKVGETFTLTGDILHSTEDNPIISWISEDTDIASVNDEGVVVANKEGTTTIIASYEDVETKCEVIVSGEDTPDIESIAFNQGSSIELKKGSGVLLQVVKTPENATEEEITFETDDSSIATVSDTGYVNAIDVGTTSITAETESGLTTSITVKVIKNGQTTIEPTKLDILGISNEIVVGKTATLKTSIQPSNATNTSLTFASSNPEIATVDSNGVVTGVSAGSCSITASTYNGIRATLSITVSSSTVEPTGVEITTGQTISMKVNGVKRIKYKVLPDNATNKTATFSSSNTSVARVDSNGLVAGIATGSAIITVKTSNGKTAFVTVNVESSATNTDTSGSGSSSGSSSSSNSGSSSDSGSSSSSDSGSSSDSSSSSSTCTNENIVTIENLGSTDTPRPIVSSISFDKTSPYTNASKTPQIKVTQIDSCVKNMSYIAYYGTKTTNLTTYRTEIVKIDKVISFDKGDGYYKVVVNATTTDGNKSKTYYASVSRSSTKPTITLTKMNYTSSTKIAKISFVAKSNSDLKISKILYCKTSSQEGCSPNISLSISQSTSVSKIYSLANVTNNGMVCAMAYNTNNVSSLLECVKIN